MILSPSIAISSIRIPLYTTMARWKYWPQSRTWHPTHTLCGCCPLHIRALEYHQVSTYVYPYDPRFWRGKEGNSFSLCESPPFAGLCLSGSLGDGQVMPISPFISTPMVTQQHQPPQTQQHPPIQAHLLQQQPSPPLHSALQPIPPPSPPPLSLAPPQLAYEGLQAPGDPVSDIASLIGHRMVNSSD